MEGSVFLLKKACHDWRKHLTCHAHNANSKLLTDGTVISGPKQKLLKIFGLAQLNDIKQVLIVIVLIENYENNWK